MIEKDKMQLIWDNAYFQEGNEALTSRNKNKKWILKWWWTYYFKVDQEALNTIFDEKKYEVKKLPTIFNRSNTQGKTVKTAIAEYFWIRGKHEILCSI